MAIDLKVLDVAETDICVAPAGKERAMLGLMFTNTSSSDVFITVYSHLKGDTATATQNIRVPNKKITGNNAFIYPKDDLRILEDLQKYTAKATVAGVISVEVIYKDIVKK